MSDIPERVVRRISERVERAPNGCWIWPGAKTEGYGRISWTQDGVKTWRLVHRTLYEATVAPIPAGLDLHHTCHDPMECAPAVARECPHRACCNPAHLEPVTRQENLLRGGTIAAARSAVTHCPAGHLYDAANTLISPKGQRQCKTCTYERNRAYYWKNREKRKAYNAAWRASQSGSASSA